ncbi:MAG: hypothetical protein ACRDZ3_22290 [Acidimicrobiia bacterium]
MNRDDRRSSRAVAPGGANPRSKAELPAGKGSIISAQLRRFIERHFVSGAHLEALLFLKARSDRAWTAVELSRELRIDAAQAADIMSRCLRSGLARGLDDRYRYSPRTATLAESVDALDQIYPAYRLAVFSVIFDRPIAPIRDFSDAFDLRAPKDR